MSTTNQLAQPHVESSPNDGVASGNWRAFWLLLFAVSAPMMVPYFAHLWRIDSYRFFPFALLFVGWILYSRWDRQFRAPRNWFCWAEIFLGFACVIGGVLLPTHWLAAVGFVLFASAFLHSSGGPNDRSLLPAVVPLLLIIRLPLGFDRLLVIELQRITTSLSSVLLDALVIPHAISNNVIQLVGRELFVAEACSGIQSVFTMAFVAVVLIVTYRRPIWMTPIYLLISVILAIAANILRVTTVAVGTAWFDLDLASGWQHEFVGYVALAISVLFLLSFDQLSVAMLHPIDPPPEDKYDSNPLITFWNFMLGADDLDNKSIPLSPDAPQDGGFLRRLWRDAWAKRAFASFAILLSFATIAQAINMQRPKLIARPTELIFSPPADLFDNRFESIQITGHESMRGNTDPRLGENADVWNCRIKGIDIESQFVLSQPYHGWHELCVCYEGSDWLVLNREVRGSVDGEDVSEPYLPLAVARFKRDNGAFAYLIYSGFDPTGDVLTPPARPGRIGTRFRDFIYDGDQFERTNVMMLQLFVVVPNKLKPDLLRSLTQDFVRLRSTLLDELNQSAPALDPQSSEERSRPTNGNSSVSVPTRPTGKLVSAGTSDEPITE